MLMSWTTTGILTNPLHPYVRHKSTAVHCGFNNSQLPSIESLPIGQPHHRGPVNSFSGVHSSDVISTKTNGSHHQIQIVVQSGSSPRWFILQDYLVPSHRFLIDLKIFNLLLGRCHPKLMCHNYQKPWFEGVIFTFHLLNPPSKTDHQDYSILVTSFIHIIDSIA